jgi:toxin-antitoxin system PIN domain toxin
MILLDVNVLVYAFREDSPEHTAYATWLSEQINSSAPYGYSEIVLSGFLRIVTHPRIYNPPSRIEKALLFAQQLIDQENAVPIRPGSRHWHIFSRLCRHANAKGNLIPDAFLAALAIESGCTFITTDRDFARFPNLKWEHPLQNP